MIGYVFDERGGLAPEYRLVAVATDAQGCLARRLLPDGRTAAVVPLLFGGQVAVATPEDMAERSWTETWDYASVPDALAAYAVWDPGVLREPAGWVRHVPSGRRRRGGDPATEEVRP